MEITILGFLLGLLLLALPFYVMLRFRVPMLKQLSIAFVRMAVYIGLTGIFLKYILQTGNSWLDLFWLFLLVLLASWSVIHKGRLKMKSFLLPVSAGLLLASVIIGLYVLILALGVHQPFEPKYWIPMFGLLIGNMIQTNSQALATYYMGLKHHHQLYLYLTGNGATHDEAVAYFMKRAIERNMKPAIAEMGYMMVSVCPIILWVMLLAGADLFSSIVIQVVVLVAAFSASTLSLLITLFVARKYLFDDYERLKKQAF